MAEQGRKQRERAGKKCRQGNTDKQEEKAGQAGGAGRKDKHVERLY
jgi:hypothetical protein